MRRTQDELPCQQGLVAMRAPCQLMYRVAKCTLPNEAFCRRKALSISTSILLTLIGILFVGELFNLKLLSYNSRCDGPLPGQ